jgi:cell division septation protein DedD
MFQEGKMSVERYGSKTDVVIKLALVFFISLLSFSIGTFVGKKFSDSQHKLAQLEPGSADDTPFAEEGREVASIPSDASEESNSKPLSDSEIAKLAEEFVTDEVEEAPHAPTEISKHAEAKSEETSHEAPEKKEDHSHHKNNETTKTAQHSKSSLPAEASVAPEASKASVRLASGQAPSEVIAEKKVPTNRIPSSLPKEVAASSLGKFTIQIASYPDEAEAQNLAAQLKAKKLEAFYVPAKIKGKTFYRVNIGLYPSSKEAKTDLDKVAKLTNVSTPIIQKIASE